MRSKNAKTISSYLFLFLGGLCTIFLLLKPNCALSGESKVMSVVYEKFIESDVGAAMHPTVIKQLSDTGFVLAGNVDALKQAWARKLNLQGDTIWTYSLSLDEVEGEDAKSMAGLSPLFHDALEMPNGNILLCGEMPTPYGKNMPTALMVVLDNNGKFLTKIGLKPTESSAKIPRYKLDACVSSGQGVYVAGHALVQDKSTLDKPKTIYVVALIEKSGNIIWQKSFFSLTDNFYVGDSGLSLTKIAEGIVLSATNNIASEMFRLNLNGEITASKAIARRVVGIVGEDEHAFFQVFSTSGKDSNSDDSIVTFDGQFKEIHKNLVDTNGKFIAKKGFRYQSDSIVLFGSTVNSSRSQFKPAFARIQHNEEHVQVTDLSKPDLFEDGSVTAATRDNAIEGFAYVVTATKKPIDPKFAGSTNVVLRGALLSKIR